MPKTNSRPSAKKALQNRTRLEWLLLGSLLLIAFLWSAGHYHWWPLNAPKENLGTAFYTSRNVSVPKSVKQAAEAGGSSSRTISTAERSSNGTSSSTNRSSSSSNTSTSSTGGGMTSGSGGSSTSPILELAAGIDTGDSKQSIDVQVNGLSQNCAVTVNLPLGLGKQEVCTYSQNGQTITVTYLDNHVISASLSGL